VTKIIIFFIINIKNNILSSNYFSYAGVAALDGLLYVMGGEVSNDVKNTVEIYNPNTNIWTMESLSRNKIRIYGGVVVNRPLNFIN